MADEVSSTLYCDLDTAEIGDKIEDSLYDLRQLTWQVGYDLMVEQQRNQKEFLADTFYRIEVVRNLLLELKEIIVKGQRVTEDDRDSDNLPDVE